MLNLEEMTNIISVHDRVYAVKMIGVLEQCGYIIKAENGMFSVCRYTYHQNPELRSSQEDVNNIQRIPFATLQEPPKAGQMTYAVAPVTLCERTDDLSATLRDQISQSQEKINGKTVKTSKKVKKSEKNSKKSTFLDDSSLDEELLASIKNASACAPAISANAEIVHVGVEKGILVKNNTKESRANEYWAIYELYAECYANYMNGASPPRWSNREFGACRSLIHRYGAEQLKLIIVRYFKFKPKNSIRDGFPFSLGYSSIAFLAGEIDADIKNPGRIIEHRNTRRELDRELKVREMAEWAHRRG